VSIQYRVGDVFDRLAEIPDDSIDLIVSSPPFLALRSYLPADHPDKGKEIGQEPTPAAFIDTHLALSAEYARVLAPHGTLCYEIGDTYSSQGGTTDNRTTSQGGNDLVERGPRPSGDGWPLAKSMCLIPHMFTGSLAYGRNLLTGEPSPAGEWRIRNVICWARPNPPVGALGDKFRPATSYITVACKGKTRYFDLDAVRTVSDYQDDPRHERPDHKLNGKDQGIRNSGPNPAGAPPLDWHADNHPKDGDWLWKMSTQPYAGAHFATFPMTLPKRLIEAMCPQRVCTECGTPSTRITGDAEYASTLGWTDCECSTDDTHWRTGIVLDPFAGSGTTLEAAQLLGRHAVGIDLDSRNAQLARERVGMFMEVES